MRTAILTHHDLDAVVSAIFAEKAFPEADCIRNGGYDKVDGNIDRIINDGYEKLVVTDLNLTDAQIVRCLDVFKEVWYFDHHIQSADHEKYTHLDHFYYYFDLRMSATAIVYRFWCEQDVAVSPALQNLAYLTDVFDLWRIHNNRFEEGFPGETDQERALLDEKKTKRKQIVEDSPKEQIEENSIVILLENREAIADVQFILPGEIFYIITHKGNGFSCSIRIKPAKENDPYNANTALKRMVDQYPHIVFSGGGHRHAAGCILNPDLDIHDIIEFIRNAVAPALNIPYNTEDEDSPPWE